MNERIKELAEEAYDNWREQDEIDANYQDSFEEEFAGLILMKVIDTIYRSDISDRKQERLVEELAHKFGLDK